MAGVNEQESFANRYYDAANTLLYQLLWKPLEPLLQPGDNVYYSPIGNQNALNFHAISDGRRRLGEKYRLHLVSSTANIAAVKNRQKGRMKSATVYGGINYNTSLARMSLEASQYADLSAGDYLTMRSADTRGSVSSLPGTLREAETIKQTLDGQRVKTQLYTRNAANEESFKAMSGHSPAIIHLATHGYFIASDEELQQHATFFASIGEFNEQGQAMLRSGLLMAGASNAWNLGVVSRDAEDGILTADEISRLDLSGTQIVVLSACETGQGMFDAFNGTFGLQRGLKNAGVGPIVMSLWKVPDEPTALLMTTLYRLLAEGVERQEALRQAQQTVAKRYPAPFNWAAFVMMD